MRILGISGFYHDAAACLVEDGAIVAAAEEERFTRKKHDSSFPENALRYCLGERSIARGGTIDAVAFYDKPLLKLQRVIESHLVAAPRGLRQFLRVLPTWTSRKLWTESIILEALDRVGVRVSRPVLFLEHHESHAASAFYPSPFQSAAVLTVDGVGEWATATVAIGDGERLDLLEELDFPHSLGLLYSAFTAFAGFRVNSGEYKLMGLAPYGEGRYTRLILDRLVDLKDDGSFRLQLDFFGFLDGLQMTNARFARLFDGPPRPPEAPITQRECDLARSIQEVTEEILLRMARHARAVTGQPRLCLAGGVALNCVANGRLLRERVVDELWVQPAAGDSGGALGAALRVWHGVEKHPRHVSGRSDAMRGSLLGPELTDSEVQAFLELGGYPFELLPEDKWADRIAALLASGAIVALCHGRMEFGPRALGNRSILADPRDPEMQAKLNVKIKHREEFRPFAPAVIAERASEYFDLSQPSPYMLLVAPVQPKLRRPTEAVPAATSLAERAAHVRSTIPAVTHVDYSARVQTVDAATNPRFHAVLKAFERRTGCAVLVNTSFNVRGEPMVCTPEDAYRCFMRTEIDWLVLGHFLVDRRRQPPFEDQGAPPAGED